MADISNTLEIPGNRRYSQAPESKPRPCPSLPSGHTYFERQFAQFLSFLLCSFHHSEEHISVDCPLVGFIQDDHAVLPQQRVPDRLAEQHSIGQKLDSGLIRGEIVEAHGVANLQKARAQSYLGCSLPLYREEGPQTPWPMRQAEVTATPRRLWEG